MTTLPAFLWLVIAGFTAFAATLFVVSIWSRKPAPAAERRTAQAQRPRSERPARPRLDAAA